jgi:hypothetical protein
LTPPIFSLQNKDMVRISFKRVYLILAFKIRIYGEQVHSYGVDQLQRPLTNQDDYKDMFSVCDKNNNEIKFRKWPHKYGGKGCAVAKGKHNSFSFACVLQNTKYAYRNINVVAELDCEYHVYVMS